MTIPADEPPGGDPDEPGASRTPPLRHPARTSVRQPPSCRPGGPFARSVSDATPVRISLDAGGGRSARIDADLDEAWLTAHLVDAAGAAHLDLARLSIRLLDDAAMARLHEQFLGVRGTTDVITFREAEAGPDDQPLEVDLAIGIEVARREAEARGHSLEREILLYAVHGLLHAAGHDDQDDASFRAMHAEEDRILEAIGVGATFASDARDSSADHSDETGLKTRPGEA